MTAPSAARRRVLARRARLLAGGSVAYNIVEGLVGLTAGSVAGSAALISFGLDPAVEVASASSSSGSSATPCRSPGSGSRSA